MANFIIQLPPITLQFPIPTFLEPLFFPPQPQQQQQPTHGGQCVPLPEDKQAMNAVQQLQVEKQNMLAQLEQAHETIGKLQQAGGTNGG